MSSSYVLFCADPLDPRSAEPDYTTEVEIAGTFGFKPILIDHDDLDRRINPAAALRHARFDSDGVAIYRGWMLRAEAYAGLFDALSSRGIRLLTSPSDYTACHHAPDSYPALAKWMPLTKWLPVSRMDDPAMMRATLSAFGASSVIVKDWVKSQASGYWDEACYIPDASDIDGAMRVIERFRELQGESLVGGLVFKAYVPLIPAGPLAYEYRAFIIDGEIVGCWPRSEGAKGHAPPPARLLMDVAARVPSPFASADFGTDASGNWWLLEVGDGQVSGLPSKDAAPAIFAALNSTVGRRHG